jgi:alginate O-acetyltransferase complex protein AlgI
MLFNSIDFLVFFTVFFFGFYFLHSIYRKILLLVASCVFYMWFIPPYILILFVTILIDFYAAKKIEQSNSPVLKKRYLLFGIINTCIVLFVFKYCNFFIDNLNALGLHSIPNLHIILPIGLSFHTFQSLGYIIDVYRGNIVAEKKLLNYANFVMMFPQLVAGPIERAGNLLPQLSSCDQTITHKDFSVGLTRFFWGLFKKVVVADTLSAFTDAAFINYQFQPGAVLLVAAIFFSIQIYCDFSGYSDMAIGVARMLGFRFKENFNLPYFSKDITEFWRRWHISLSTWFKDYLFSPIALARRNWGTGAVLFATFITFLISGLWHGAGWNFLIWGIIHGLYLCIETVTGLALVKPVSFIGKSIRILYSFILVSFALLFFRSQTLEQAITIIKKIVTHFDSQKFWYWDLSIYPSIISGIVLLFCFEYFVLRNKTFDQLYENKNGNFLLYSIIVGLILLVLLLGNSNGNQFIYFQF